MQTTKYYTISDLADEFDISTRTIRYYEELGLLIPLRTEKGVRQYTNRDRARLRLILRGKKFGFTLEEIREMILLFYEDQSGMKQLEKTILYGDQKIAQIDQQIQELQELKQEMLMFKNKFKEQLKKLREE